MRGWLSTVKSYVSSVIEDQHDISDLRGNWLRVQHYYQTVQRTSDEGQLVILQSKLPTIEGHLNRMIDLLVKEKEDFVVSLEDDAPDLPPCYEYLLRRGSGGGASQQQAIADHTGGGEALPSVENDYVIFNICQYAKHDQPQGTRGLMLRVLYRILTEVDPQTHGTMLKVCSDYVTMPLCDALHKLALALDPSRSSGTSNSPAQKRSGKQQQSGSVSQQQQITLQQDRALLVALTRCLCEKLEQHPCLAAYFTFPSGSHNNTTSLLLLDTLAPFVYDRLLDLSPNERLACLGNTLRGLLALAKCSLAEIQNLIAARVDIANSIFDVLRTTLLTFIKVHQNNELRIQMAGVVEIVQWVDTMLLLAPHVSEQWDLLYLFQEQVLRCTVLPLFRTPDERSYVAITAILTHMLKDALVGGSILSNTIGHALLASRVDHEHHQVYVAASQLPSDYGEVTKPFATEYLWPRMVDVSDHVVCSTLQLTAAVASRCPEQFLKYALMLNAEEHPLFFSGEYLTSCADDTAHSGRSASPASGDTNTLPPAASSPVSQSLTGASKVHQLVPQINVSDCFPQRIISQRGLCGTSLDGFAEDVLRSLLEMECALTTEQLANHRVRVERVAKNSNAPPAILDGVTTALCVGKNAEYSDNVFFRSEINGAPVVDALCDAVGSMLEHRFQVNAVLSELITTMCLLPDIRVSFTLLDKSRGALTSALKSLSVRVNDLIDREEKQNPGSPVVPLLSLYQRCSQRPFFDPNDDGFCGDDVAASMMKSAKVFVESCVCLEGLRHELEALMCYHVISEALSELSSTQSIR